MRELLSGNEAIARGAWESGVKFAAGYPGTPSTEILENLVKYQKDVHCEWAPNEKVALETAVGASFGGARVLVTMKHVGMNVAADPLMTLAMIGAVGGLVIVIADDPGMHSSQNEQDSRHWGAFAKIPILEPADSQEASAYVRYGLELSERCQTPVILRSTTRLAHSRSIVELHDRENINREINFVAEQSRFVTIPLWARQMRIAVEGRMEKLRQTAETDNINQIFPPEQSEKSEQSAVGIISAGVVAAHAREIFADATLLKLGMTYPLPKKLIRRFAENHAKIIVIEELDSLIESQIKAWGIACDGRNLFSPIGEITPDIIRAAKAKSDQIDISDNSGNPAKSAETADLPARPPVLCPGCPHRGVFMALKKFDVAVMGDIGCYSLAALPPLSRLNTILCMGGAIGMAHGLQQVGEKKKVVGVMGDSTFFHSGITGLLNTVYNGGNSTVIVLDNRITAMTGHQEHPGSGRTLEGKPAPTASIAEIGRAVGVKRVREINPYAFDETCKAIAEEIAADAPSLIISRAPCPLHAKKPVGEPKIIDAEKCVNCRACLKVGCPAIESAGAQEKPQINLSLCAGCSLCAQICPRHAIR